ncbi:MAG: hypothetical protein Hals2KO_20930 [Halioglobus sp.]
MNIQRFCKASALVAALSTPLTGHANDWQFELEPYLFGSFIDGEASAGRVEGAAVDMDFKDDILDNLDSALMVHMEALHGSGWGVMLDYSFMKLKNDISLPLNAELDTKMRQGVLEVDGFYRRAWGDAMIDYTAGVRWWDQDIDVELDTAVLPGDRKIDIKEDWVDVVIGARLQQPLNDNWTFVARGDIGGFGLEADFTSQLSVGLKYRMNDSFLLDINYKAIWVDYDNGDKGESGYFAYDTLTQGPALGLIFQF